jgi:hypothetical protein
MASRRVWWSSSRYDICGDRDPVLNDTSELFRTGDSLLGPVPLLVWLMHGAYAGIGALFFWIEVRAWRRLRAG